MASNLSGSNQAITIAKRKYPGNLRAQQSFILGFEAEMGDDTAAKALIGNNAEECGRLKARNIVRYGVHQGRLL